MLIVEPFRVCVQINPPQPNQPFPLDNSFQSYSNCNCEREYAEPVLMRQAIKLTTYCTTRALRNSQVKDTLLCDVMDRFLYAVVTELCELNML